MADAELPIVPAEPDDTAPVSSADLEKKQRKRAQKARAVWISFAGRIIAQILGAVASVALGIMVLQRYQAGPAGGTPAASTPAAVNVPAAAPARAALPRRPGEAAIAVLPLDNLSGDAAQEYFADGMTEALVAALAQIDGLKVISRTSTMRYKTEHPSVPEIARALGVDLVVEGSVLQADGQVRVTTQLIDGATDEHLWARSYTRRLEDVITLQDEVAATIGAEIMGTVTRRPGVRAAAPRAVDPAVYDLYLRGRHAWNQRTPEGLKTAIEYFSRAVAQDASFVLAHVGLADTYAVQGSPGTGLLDARAPMALARQSATRALELDPSLAEAHTALGGVLFFGDRDFPAAEAALGRAIEINPNYPVAHEWLSVLLAELGRDPEAWPTPRRPSPSVPLKGSCTRRRAWCTTTPGGMTTPSRRHGGRCN
jgi:TolB-like protein